MRPLRHTFALAALAALSAVALAEPATAASKKQQDVLPYGRVPLDCLLTSSTPPARLSIRNSTTETIPAGRQIGWRTANGEHGAFLMPFSFDPGKIIGVGPGSGASCSAWMTLPALQMSQ
jgi:hypothetical protein